MAISVAYRSSKRGDAAKDLRLPFLQIASGWVVLFDRCDFLALPTAQVWPFDAALRWPRGDLAVLQLAHAYEKTARDVLAIRPRA